MEQEMLTLAIENVSTAPELLVETINNFNTSDGTLKFSFQGSSFNMPFTIERKITAAQLPFIEERLSKEVIIFEYASKAVKEQLRKLNINYIEISGNAYISQDRFYIFIDTNKRIKLEDTDSNAAFSKTGLKVIYQLLIDKNATKYSYRALGEISGVSIDTIGRVYRELVRDKYLVKINNKEYQVFDYDRLFKDWVTLFNKVLRPKLKKRSFRFNNNQNIQSLLATNFNGKIGGELAAEQLSKNNIAEKANIYINGSFVDLARRLDLRPDKDGQITMIEQFWNNSFDNSERIADLPLVYADLISEPTSRNLETAKLIFNEYAYQSS